VHSLFIQYQILAECYELQSALQILLALKVNKTFKLYEILNGGRGIDIVLMGWLEKTLMKHGCGVPSVAFSRLRSI